MLLSRLEGTAGGGEVHDSGDEAFEMRSSRDRVMHAVDTAISPILAGNGRSSSGAAEPWRQLQF